MCVLFRVLHFLTVYEAINLYEMILTSDGMSKPRGRSLSMEASNRLKRIFGWFLVILAWAGPIVTHPERIKDIVDRPLPCYPFNKWLPKRQMMWWLCGSFSAPVVTERRSVHLTSRQFCLLFCKKEPLL